MARDERAEIVPLYQPTTELPEVIDFPTFSTVLELFDGAPSPAGYHRVSTFLECPEKARLESLSVRRKDSAWVPGEPLNALGFGILWHALQAIRTVLDTNSALEMLRRLPDIHEEDRMKVFNMLKMYELTYPLGQDPWKVLGVEALVFTDIGNGFGGSCIRTVRYDTVVKPWEPDQEHPGHWKLSHGVFSLERKTTGSGVSTLASYQGQFSVQSALWNANPALVAKYGPMLGVIGDAITKGTVPEAKRVGPFYIPKLQQQRSIEWLRIPERIRFEGYPMPDGSMPRMLHSCWGRYGPCQFIDLCHRGDVNSYEQAPRRAA